MRLEKKLNAFAKDSEFRFKELEENKAAIGSDSSVDKKKIEDALRNRSGSGADVTENKSYAARTIYESALAQFQRKNYAEAEKGFKRFLKDYPQDKLAANAYYWLGESYYARNSYDSAAMSFLDGSRKYPKSVKAGHSLLKLGASLTMLKEPKEACATFDEVEETYLPKDETLRSLLERERAKAGCR